jgi:hypothetical protein
VDEGGYPPSFWSKALRRVPWPVVLKIVVLENRLGYPTVREVTGTGTAATRRRAATEQK